MEKLISDINLSVEKTNKLSFDKEGHLKYNSFKVFKDYVLSFCFNQYKLKRKIIKEYSCAVNSKLDFVEIISKINLFDRVVNLIFDKQEKELISYDQNNILYDWSLIYNLEDDDVNLKQISKPILADSIKKVLYNEHNLIERKENNTKLVKWIANYYCSDS